MTNQTIGVWISDDGTVGTPDPSNLYRYVGNDPTNKVDPTGLAGTCITGSDVVSHTKYTVGSGIWMYRSAPASAGKFEDGAIEEGGMHGYMSSIRVNGNPNVQNCCNTPLQIFAASKFNDYGGAIALKLRNLSTGTYDVKIKIEAFSVNNLLQRQKQPKLPSFTVYKANNDLGGSWKQLWKPTWKIREQSPPTSSYTARDETTLTVRLGYQSGILSDSSDSVLLVPSFSFTAISEKEYMTVLSKIFVTEIKMVPTSGGNPGGSSDK